LEDHCQVHPDASGVLEFVTEPIQSCRGTLSRNCGTAWRGSGDCGHFAHPLLILWSPLIVTVAPRQDCRDMDILCLYVHCVYEQGSHMFQERLGNVCSDQNPHRDFSGVGAIQSLETSGTDT